MGLLFIDNVLRIKASMSFGLPISFTEKSIRTRSGS